MVHNVLDYGAVGDGVADDAPAIRKAIVAAIRDLGGTVFFPQGVYLCKSTIQLNNDEFEAIRADVIRTRKFSRQPLGGMPLILAGPGRAGPAGPAQLRFSPEPGAPIPPLLFDCPDPSSGKPYGEPLNLPFFDILGARDLAFRGLCITHDGSGPYDLLRMRGKRPASTEEPFSCYRTPGTPINITISQCTFCGPAVENDYFSTLLRLAGTDKVFIFVDDTVFSGGSYAMRHDTGSLDTMRVWGCSFRDQKVAAAVMNGNSNVFSNCHFTPTTSKTPNTVSFMNRFGAFSMGGVVTNCSFDDASADSPERQPFESVKDFAPNSWIRAANYVTNIISCRFGFPGKGGTSISYGARWCTIKNRFNQDILASCEFQGPAVQEHAEIQSNSLVMGNSFDRGGEVLIARASGILSNFYGIYGLSAIGNCFGASMGLQSKPQVLMSFTPFAMGYPVAAPDTFRTDGVQAFLGNDAVANMIFLRPLDFRNLLHTAQPCP